MHVFHSFGHVLGGTLLISGTMIGVGMLALPVVTGPGGFIPAMIIYLITWLFMLLTGLLLLEVCTWMPQDANLITMTRRLLGPIGKNLCWLVYLFLFLTVMIAHIAGAGQVLNQITGGKISIELSAIIYVILFSPVVYLGTHSVDRLNLCLMIGVAVSYFSFVFVSYNHVNIELLQFSDWSKAWIALPVLFTAFTYQVIIPTLMTYMERNVRKVRLAIILGTTIPLVVYLVWELLILGIIPVDSLIEAKKHGETAVAPLRHFLHHPNLFRIGQSFAFFTMTTSYLALALAYLDFLADGLKLKKRGIQKVLLCLAVFIPPTLISLLYPKIFLTALGYAGGISCALLFGLLPPLMVWIGRYVKGYSLENQQIRGGKTLLTVLFIFVILELGIEITEQMLLLSK
jgi:tyrosine-specific transport protein